MFVPHGYTEESVIKDINHVINALSKHFCFGYHDIEDIRQEGFVFALECLPYYDSFRKTSLRTFLYVHIKNQFINMQRDQCFNKTPPCPSCIFYDEKEKFNKKCTEFVDCESCERYRDWIKHNASKKNLIQPSRYEPFYVEEKNDNFLYNLDNLQIKEILQIIDRDLPVSFRHDYCRFLQGARLSELRKDIIVQIIRQILIKRGILENG